MDEPKDVVSAPETVTHHEEVLEEEELTSAQREAMKKSLIDQMLSIQELIKTYRDQQLALQRDVAEFVAREVTEQNQMHSIVADVERDQREALRNPEYLRWAAKNRKGEFQQSGNAASDGGGTETADKVADALRLGFHPEVEHETHVGVNHLQHTIAIQAFSGAKAALAGWRQPSAAISQELDRMVEALLPAADDETTLHVVFLNGLPLLHASLYDLSTARRLTEDLYHIPPSGKATPEALCKWYLDTIYTESSFSSSSREKLKCLLLESPCTKASLTDDESDVLGIMPLPCVMASVPVRIFVVDGVAQIIEVCDPRCDILEQTLGSDAEAILTRHCASLLHVIAPSLRCSRSLISALVSTQEGTLLDIRSLSPSATFRWHLSWAEVCGIGKRQASSGASLVVKRTRSKLAALECADSLSEIWFPLLNQRLQQQEERDSRRSQGGAVVDPPRRAAGSVRGASPAGERQGVSIPTMVVGGLLVAAVSVATTALLLNKGKK